jgi:hypothetical protein
MSEAFFGPVIAVVKLLEDPWDYRVSILHLAGERDLLLDADSFDPTTNVKLIPNPSAPEPCVRCFVDNS